MTEKIKARALNINNLNMAKAYYIMVLADGGFRCMDFTGLRPVRPR